MILREIPREYEAVRYDGNKVPVEKFVARHGGRIEFPDIEGLEQEGTLHTAQGTEKVTPGVFVVSDAQDQLSRIFPKDIGTRFEILDPNADKLNVPPPVIPPEPKVGDDEDEQGDDDDYDYTDLDAILADANNEVTPSGLVVPVKLGPNAQKRMNRSSDSQRLDEVEATLNKIVELLSQ